MPQWTEEQQQAISWRGCHTLVSAGAGSGKTAVLIQRIISRITEGEHPLDVDRLLVLTFTNAAAAEMRHRLARALYEALAQNPGDRHLERQLVLLQRAQITTLHAFCLDSIKKYFYLLDLDPKARIGNAGELLLLRDKVLDDLFEEVYVEPDSPLVLLLNHYNRGLGDDAIKDLILQIAEFSYSMAQPEEWLDSLLVPYQQENISVWLSYAADQMQQMLETAAGDLAKAAALCAQPDYGIEKYHLTIAAEAKAVAACTQAPAALGEAGWNGWLEAINGIAFQRLPSISKKQEYDEACKEQVASLRSDAKDLVKKIQGQYAAKSYAQILLETQKLCPVATALVGLTKRYLALWNAKKREKKLLEFSDLEHHCLALLTDPALEVAAELQKQFAEVFVDEYQDINQVQEAILQAVSGPDNRFMVGDIKQSIYRFRLAEPGLFLEKYLNYGASRGGKRIDLQKNFRSQQNIIACVNFLFRQLLVGEQTEICYDNAAQLIAGNESYPALPAELVIIDQQNFQQEADDEDGEEEEAADFLAAEKEAQAIVAKIQQERQQDRAYGDIVVLLRSLKNWSNVIAEALSTAGIPCKADGAASFYDSAEIETICNLLKVIDNPLQDIELAAVLHAPVVGLSLKELAAVRLLAPGRPFYQAAQLSQDQRVRQFLQRLAGWRRFLHQGSVAALVQQIYRETGLPQMLGALPGGSVKQANLRQFLLLAQDYDNNNYKGLYRFLQFVARNKEQDPSGGQRETTLDAVTIMSIHRSKGLEFPVVIVAGLGKKINDTDTRKDILLHRKLGLGLRQVDLQAREKYPTLGYSVLADQVTWETKAEELRILYVALTRPQEKLILIGTSRNLAGMLNKNKDITALAGWPLPVAALAKYNSYLDWLLLALLRHPEGAVLRQLAGVEQGLQTQLALAQDSSRWQLEVTRRLANTAAEQQAVSLPEPLQQFLAGVQVQSEAAPQVAASLAWQYPWQALTQLPVKWSATSLARLRQQRLAPWQEQPERRMKLLAEAVEQQQEESDREETPMPSQPRLEANWHADLGTLIHGLLEQVDLQKIAAGQLPEPLLQELLAANPAAAELKAAVRVKQIARFFDTSVGAGLLQTVAAGRPVLREASFTLALALAELAAASGLSLVQLEQLWQTKLTLISGEQVFLQGVIDLAYNTPQGWVLVDYKTGKNFALTDGGVRQKYGPQLQLYQKALEDICGARVVRKIIYFTQNNRLVEC